MREPTYLRGPLPGPTVAIFGGIHGDETCGVRLVDELRAGPAPFRGTLVLAYGNPPAIAAGVRQLDANLNRLFRPAWELSPEFRAAREFPRSRELMSVLDGCDALLDVHSSPTPGSPPFVICEHDADAVAETLPFPVRCSGFSDMEAGGTDGYMYRNGKVGICVECGQHGDPEALGRARAAARAFLAAYGMGPAPAGGGGAMEKFRAEHAYLTRTDRFRAARAFRDFEPVEAGEVLGMDGDVPVAAPFSGAVLFAGDRDRVGVEGFVLVVPEDGRQPPAHFRKFPL